MQARTTSPRLGGSCPCCCKDGEYPNVPSRPRDPLNEDSSLALSVNMRIFVLLDVVSFLAKYLAFVYWLIRLFQTFQIRRSLASEWSQALWYVVTTLWGSPGSTGMVNPLRGPSTTGSSLRHRSPHLVAGGALNLLHSAMSYSMKC